MADFPAGQPSLIIHIGPHKTGSTSIQGMLHQNAALLKSAGVVTLAGELPSKAGKAVESRDFDSAKGLLSLIEDQIARSTAPVTILSQEDFAGDMFGRRNATQIYPTLVKNIRIMSRIFARHRPVFVFFRRDETEWLQSCYAQHLRYRNKFSSFETFAAAVQGFSWDDILGKVQENFPDSFFVEDYRKEPEHGVTRLLSYAGFTALPQGFDTSAKARNTSLPPAMLRRFERLNRFADIPKLLPVYKERLLAAAATATENAPVVPEGRNPQWPPAPGGTAPGLEALSKRAAERVGTHTDVADMLPDPAVDLAAMGARSLPDDAQMPAAGRADMRDQAGILRYHLRGRSELAWTTALCISYLRRDTQLTEKARDLFHRIWREEGQNLVAEFSTRWLISNLQTFLDHGRNEAQRLIGGIGYFYANMMKIYEGERAIEGIDADATYAGPEPQTKSGFRGMDRYTLGGTDLLLNTNALALSYAQMDPVAGPILEELLLRVKHSHSVFSRNDQSRARLGASQPGFQNTWTFFEEVQPPVASGQAS
ncbi:hypothetical protein HOY34_08160 [Xinfangfangia sp. D13-10-4-6]|uniref:hypothetical protein n=1 Tax=Pseudogemmobacter hezensis TaxID=2737662 RepID=UPI00155488E5|nr:hypothetical protein [Pseudogemmobacter hezensis]NPD15174.1 hypothetical protein [Pseudogemmobacter hezensis]